MSIDQILDTELSLSARIGHVLLLIAAIGMTVTCAALLASETGLPQRTIIAFAVMCVIGLAWTGYAIWTLRHRQPLLAGHRLVASKIGIGAAALFTVGAFALYAAENMIAGLYAGLTGGALVAVAIWMHQRGKAHLNMLLRRKAQLESDLA